LALVGVVFAGVAHAEGPAVSGLNGKVSLEGGATGSRSGGSSAVGTAEGSIAAPLGSRFGAQLDGIASTSYSSFLGGGGAHVFWRDSTIGLAGPVAALGGGRGATVGLYGAEGELYAGIFTVGALGGYLSATSPSGVVPSGGVWQGRLTVYPIADLALSLGGGQEAGFGSGSVTIEYQPAFIARHNVSLFVDSDIGENGYYRVTSGVRFYFGPEKTLIRRQREDDPLVIRQIIRRIEYRTVNGANGSIQGGNGGNAGLFGTSGNGGQGGLFYGNGG
jgi:hypothetical protein